MTARARAAINGADTVVGYSTYVKLIEPMLGGKQVVSTGMTAEVKRCAEAVKLAREGKHVALVSSGDPGVYGMAGLVLEILRGGEANPLLPPFVKGGSGGISGLPFKLEIIPGVPAVCSAAASLGAPLMHDFAVISLSDLLTPWELIARRLEAAAGADFVIALYNPRSKGRPHYLGEALGIIKKHRPGATPVGIVKDSRREGEKVTISTLEGVPVDEVDMTTIVIVGNSQSYTFLDYIVTPRGYAGRKM
jgi:precorrin-3B C17-methyltransferase